MAGLFSNGPLLPNDPRPVCRVTAGCSLFLFPGRAARSATGTPGTAPVPSCGRCRACGSVPGMRHLTSPNSKAPGGRTAIDRMGVRRDPSVSGELMGAHMFGYLRDPAGRAACWPAGAQPLPTALTAIRSRVVKGASPVGGRRIAQRSGVNRGAAARAVTELQRSGTTGPGRWQQCRC